VSSNNGAGKTGTSGNVGKNGTFSILGFWVEDLEWRGFGFGDGDGGLRVGGLGKYNTSLPCLPPFQLCYYYLCHYYRFIIT